jgi:hypothetical protein
MRVRKSLVLPFTLGVVSLGSGVYAQTTIIGAGAANRDGDFESATGTNGGSVGQNNGAPLDWAGTGTVGVLYPSGSTGYPGSGFYAGANLSQNGKYIGFTQGIGTNYSNTTTTLYAAATTYSVSALFGNSYESAGGNGTFDLLDGTTKAVLATDVVAAPSALHTVQVNFTYDTAASGAGVGDPVEFLFDSGANGTQAFDNVVVTATPDVAAGPVNATYAANGSGDYNVASNWSTNSVPNGIDSEAQFQSSITSAQTVYSNINITVGTMIFNNANTYVLAGAGSLTFQTSTGSALVDTQAGTHKITLPITIASNTAFNAGSGATLVIQAPVVVDSGATLTETGTGTVTFLSTITVDSGGAVSLAATSNALSLSLNGASTAALLASSSTTKTALQLDTLNIASGSSFDLSNNDMVVHGGSLATINAEAGTGYNGGLWNGTGINSSAAAADTAHLTAVGVMQNSNGQGTAIYSTFGNVAVSSSDILVKDTYYGDADLNGQVDGSDYSRIDNGYLLQLTGWANGDFNYDGVIDGSDYTLIDNAYNTQGASLADEISNAAAVSTAQIAGASAVPEPTTLGFLSIATAGLLGRRERRRF